MAKIRIYELSKKIKVSNKDILAKAAELGVKAKSHSSSIDDEAAERISKLFAKKGKLKEKKKALKPAKPKKEKKEAKKVKKVKKDVKKEKLPESLEKEDTSIVTEDIIPDRFKKEATEGKLAKFKSKPGMQKAFDSIRRIESTKRGYDFKPRYKKPEKKTYAKKSEAGVVTLPTQPRKRVLKFQEGTTVKEFAELIGQKLPEIIKKFMELGYMTTINQPLDVDAAQIVAESFDIKIEPIRVESEEAELEETEVDVSVLSPRPPIVTIMGHVDHGKTTLLDAIRETNVTKTEAGGITQHIGAYKVRLKDKEITFLDTPGHEAFTMMRARGAKVTDIVVLVVAADDSVMPQTIEAINHAKAANVPIIVAINKIDKPGADITRVKNELSQYDVVTEEWGGQNVFVEISAKMKTGIEHLLEMILLQAEVLELKADYNRRVKGTVIEAKLDKGRGPVATVLVNTGTLKIGDPFLVGTVAGRVRALIDDTGKRIETAGPSAPVEVIGFPDIPQVGDVFVVLEDERRARQIAVGRLHKSRVAGTADARTKKLTLDELYEKVKEGEIRELNIIVKADVQGSVEAVKDALENLSSPQVKVKIIHTGAGGINESDIMLAAASNAIVIGFNVRPDAKANAITEKEGVDVNLYNVIYEIVDHVKKALEGLLEPTITEKVLGRAEVRQIFKVSRVGTIAGCYVLDGMITRASSGIRVIRDDIVVYDSKIASLKRFKEDVKDVQTGFECGIMIENFNDVKVGDIFEDYIKEEVAAKLS